MCIGRCVTAENGNASRRPRRRTADTRTGSDRNISRCARDGWRGGVTAPWPCAASRNFCRRLQIELEHHRLGFADEADLLRPVEIGLIGVLVVALLRRELMVMEAAGLDVGLELLRIGRAAPVACAVRAAKAGQRADAGHALVVDDVVGIAAGIARRAVVGDEARQLRAARRCRSARSGSRARRGPAAPPAGGSRRPGRPAPEIGRSSSEMQSQRSR